MQRIRDSGENEGRKHLLAGFVRKYLKLDAAQQREYERLLDTAPYRGVKVMTTPWHEEGRRQGILEGEKKVLCIQLERRFGPLSREIRERLDALPAEQVEGLSAAILDAKSLKELGLED